MDVGMLGLRAAPPRRNGCERSYLIACFTPHERYQGRGIEVAEFSILSDESNQ